MLPHRGIRILNRIDETPQRETLCLREERSQDFGGGNAWDPSAPPTLSANFIVENPPIDRVIAVTTEPHFIFDSFTNLKCARPMPLFGVPGLIDHF